MTQDHKLTVRFKRLKELLFFSESCQCPGAREEPGARGGRRRTSVGPTSGPSAVPTRSPRRARTQCARTQCSYKMSCVTYHGYTLACAFARQPE